MNTLSYPSGIKVIGGLIVTIFVCSIGLNFHFATHGSSHQDTGYRKLESDEWKDIADEALCNYNGNAEAVFEALYNYTSSMDWFVSVCTDDEDLAYKKKHGKVHFMRRSVATKWWFI